MFYKIFAMHLQIDWILNILMVKAKNDEERSAICMACLLYTSDERMLGNVQEDIGDEINAAV